MFSAKKCLIAQSVLISLFSLSAHANMKIDDSGKMVHDGYYTYCSGYDNNENCADIDEVLDAANLAMNQANQYADSKISDIKNLY